ncbi:hypothetical protein [Kordia sp.]|uniref:hypothetical protein n=1 Tax=Kordia sp. TaxID=1965332 RepID=UPI0025BB9216|nr:hypothetical protein [Kordia sp.]MCH2194386.1 hypothetical protein [Kordia sp.]
MSKSLVNKVRDHIAEELKQVTQFSSPKVYNAIQRETGYKNVESHIIQMMIDSSITVSACIPNVELML